VVRWGRFADRQRYRCRCCKRCFSDLTGTPLSNIKRLDAWPMYERCLTDSDTVRRSAARADIAISTSFRWRHLILQSLRDRELPDLAGLVEFAHVCLPYSAKGRGRNDRASRLPTMYVGREPMLARRGCTLVVARDRRGQLQADCLDTATLTGEQLCALFDDLMGVDCTLLCPQGRYSQYAALLHTRRGESRELIHASPFRAAQGAVYHNHNAFHWLVRLRRWLGSFRGVSTWYMSSYLEWRRVLDLVEHGPWLPGLIECTFRPDCQQRAGTGRQVRAGGPSG